MIAQVATDKLRAEIAASPGHGYFDILLQNEPSIDWLAWAAKNYRISHSVSTLTTYSAGICAFREMLIQNGLTLAQTIEKIKMQASGDLQTDITFAYEILDEFVTYLDSTRQVMPHTTRGWFNAVCGLFSFLKIKLDERELGSITLPKPQSLQDEYPPNQTIRAILNAASLNIRAYVMVIIDTGFEPVDAAQLKVKDIKFNENPVRVSRDREKTNQPLEGFLSEETTTTIKTIITTKNKLPTDYVFTKTFTAYTVNELRAQYNIAAAKAGFGKVAKVKTQHAHTRHAKVDKIDGHKYGKYHLKVYKKRWFTLAVSAGVPEYVAQGMLGRKQYLDQYMRQPLEKRQEFAKKILKAVSVYAEKTDKQEVLKEVSKILGFDVTAEQADLLKSRLQMFMTLPASKIDALFGSEK